MNPLCDAPTLDHTALDLAAADSLTFRLCQTFRYTYATPIESLRHRLVVVPPTRHGEVHLRGARVAVEGAAARRRTVRDAMGNTVVRFTVAHVEEYVEFQLQAILERVRGAGPVLLPATALRDPRHLLASRLTEPDDALLALAADARAHGPDPLAVADRLCVETHRRMRYEFGVTTVETTAAEALAAGRGVCQDYAHIMVSACRAAGVPARYVSGHLLSQGGTHAWVEVIVAHPSGAEAVAFDPCHARRAHAGYVTVATGRDYADVAPTSGTYARGGPGDLTSRRDLALISIHPAP
ncbi:transglutaminase family protein [Luedemannella helvata]|uniref:Transglutaminase family protein n=1 Tax=Luedemannella helvata TaxID=349315 RepID=A0ABP4W2Y7_9ACTN